VTVTAKFSSVWSLFASFFVTAEPIYTALSLILS